MSPSVGTARRAALGESTSSNRGTGSPRRSWSGPSGQSPLFAVTNAPSATSVTTARRSQRSRRPVRAHHQTWTMAPRNATVIAPWPARKARAAGDNRPLAMLARMASTACFVQTRGYRVPCRAEARFLHSMVPRARGGLLETYDARFTRFGGCAGPARTRMVAEWVSCDVAAMSPRASGF